MKPVGSLLENKTIHIAILFLLISAVFGSAPSFDFVWDDKSLLLGNAAIKKLDIFSIFLYIYFDNPEL